MMFEWRLGRKFGAIPAAIDDMKTNARMGDKITDIGINPKEKRFFWLEERLCYNLPLKTTTTGTVNSIKQSLQLFQRRVLDWFVRVFAHGALEARAEKIVRLFEEQIQEKSRVLDLGGGWGFYAEPLKKRGHESLVLDVIKPGYQKAPVVLYDGFRIPFPDASFDVTVLATMLHHVPDPAALFREVRRVTRKKVVVVEDLYQHAAGRCWTICRDRILNVEFLSHPHQFRTDGGWRVFFNAAGFEVCSFKRFYTWLMGLRILNGVYVLEKSKS